MTRSTVIAYLKKLFRLKLFQNFFFVTSWLQFLDCKLSQKFLLICETDIQILFSWQNLLKVLQ